jgi:hypothetical protein
MAAESGTVTLSAERMATEELCPRRRYWTERYVNLRVSLTRALYMSLDAGLRSETSPERDAEAQFLALARDPGLDVVGGDIFAIAVHHAKLAAILSVVLRDAWDGAWKAVEPTSLPREKVWNSALYETADGVIRRIVLVDRWTDDRRMQELWGWRTLGEVCALEKRIHMTAITIGPSHEKHRHSAWTRCHQAPRTGVFRFKRKQGTESFGPNWRAAWREDLDITTNHWLTRMREDGCMEDLVHNVSVPVPKNKPAYLKEMYRMARQMERNGDELPPMRLAGCFGFSPCAFRTVCHGPNEPKPENYGFTLRK